MSEETDNEKPEGNIKQTIDAVTALTKAIPIYEDAVQPVAKQTGKALETIGKAVNVALAPISLVIWGYDQIEDFLENKVSEKLENVPEDRISTPPPNVAGPAIEALRFTGENEILRDMFANLIANSLDTKTVLEAHPSFVDIIKSLSPDEGLILKAFARSHEFPIVDIRLEDKKIKGYHILHRNVSQIGTAAGCEHMDLTPNYIDNLCRLGILEIPSGTSFKNKEKYDGIKNTPHIRAIIENYNDNEEFYIDFDEKIITVTGIGQQFINACIKDKGSQA